MRKLAALALAASMTLPVFAQTDGDVMSSATFKGMEVRNIGPAYMSGRIADIAVDPTDVGTWFVGVASGGVWKTVNAGTTWTPVFDGQSVYSIGDVTIDPSNPNIVWVGTGENNGGRHISFGDGVYKSTDGGKTWNNMGLPNSERIGDIVVHPDDSDTVWVTAQGPLWTSGGERGIYKTTDGGKTWTQVLTGPDEWTGVASLAIDPDNPDRLYATTWARQRTIAAYVGTNKHAALHISNDGGETWEKVTTGLPTTNWGKTSVAVSPVDSNYVYLAIELDNRTGGFFRSTDKGASWERMSDMVGAATGPHYYQEIYADPHTRDRVYFTSAQSQISDDGGRTWTPINNEAKHGDDHAFAFHHSDPDFFLVGSDGGVYETRDDGATYRYIRNLPLTQFYKIAADDAEPFYHVYGGTQDNNTQGGPSRTIKAEGISNDDWYVTLFADGHQPATEPGNPDILYSQWQQGNLARHDKKTREIVYIRPQEKPGEPAERYNWDAPINVSAHDPKRIYHASQRVWRSDDRGDTWTAISGDLTRDQNRMQLPMMGQTWSAEAGWDTFAMSNYNTIANFAESPIDENILYVGTDDGLIQVTSDGGENWTRYEIGRIRGVPGTAYVNDIRADLFDADTVYAALDNHKYGDFKPYLIKSTDRGRTWKSIASNLPDKHLVWRITQDHVNPNLLFIGTEFGLFFTVDGGEKWVELTGGVPTISFRDVRIQRRENDLVAGSFGRGIYILDDYTPLRGMTEEALENNEALLFTAGRTVDWYRPNSMDSDARGNDRFLAPNPDFGAVLTYYLKDDVTTAKQRRQAADKATAAAGDDLMHPSWESLEAENQEEKASVFVVIKDTAGNVIRRINGSTKKGVHRVAWDLRYPSQSAVTGSTAGGWNPFGSGGSMTAPGTYTATLYKRVDGVVTEIAPAVSFETQPIAEGTLPQASHAEVAQFAKEAANANRALSAANNTIRAMQRKVALYRTALDRSMTSGELDAEWTAIRKEIYSIDNDLNGLRVTDNTNPNPATIASRIGLAMMAANTSSYGPTPTHREQFGYALEGFEGIKNRLNRLSTQTMPAFEAKMIEAGAPWSVGQTMVPSAN